MDAEPSDIAVGAMMTVFGFAGLFLAAGARDDEMYVFGFALVGFSLAFVMGLVKRHYDRRDAAVAAARITEPAPVVERG